MRPQFLKHAPFKLMKPLILLHNINVKAINLNNAQNPPIISNKLISRQISFIQDLSFHIQSFVSDGTAMEQLNALGEFEHTVRLDIILNQKLNQKLDTLDQLVCELQTQIQRFQKDIDSSISSLQQDQTLKRRILH
ncbi:hypothetical protein SS50377_26241 [Spironucleus salmonicida]|uniref:Uncharacterized protein n=1 Tax=Spironucleus salmonicida TaxID=348837 RepID=A0A9P8LPE0_9EUKA|nr:hypothetical protein SS50377_26241 [Spironucleus salmonicida]